MAQFGERLRDGRSAENPGAAHAALFGEGACVFALLRPREPLTTRRAVIVCCI